MNSKQRRTEERLIKRLKKEILADKEIILKAPSQQHTKHKESLRPLRWGILFFDRTLSGTKLLWRLVVAVLTLVGGYAIFRPHVSVEPYIPLNPVDPYRTQFTIKNENLVFEVHDIKSVCWPRSMESGNGFSVLSLVPLQNVKRTIPSLEPSGNSTVDCPPVIGGLGTYTGEVLNAELEIVVSYKQSWWPLMKTERNAFRAMRDVNKGVHWLHTTPAEEKPIFPK